ncbi:MAG: DNA replication/repair protein RecF [Faecalibacterium sp.]
MRLKSLSLSHFRNITDADFHPHPELTVICGNNGQGKTNLLEAVWLFTGGKSFRGSKDVELIQKDNPFAVLDGQFIDQTILNEPEPQDSTNIRITIARPDSERAGRQAKKNDVSIGRATNLAGDFPAVVFAPNHLTLVKGSPDGRRRFIDGALCQLYPNYLTIYRRYIRAIAQKNATLKQAMKQQSAQNSFYPLLDVYDTEIAKQGEEMQRRRLQYLDTLVPLAMKNYQEISKGAEQLEIKYQAQFEIGQFAEKLAHSRVREIAAGCCLVGPHREDFEIKLNGDLAKIYASQGQQRSAVLSLKLAEAASTHSITGVHPVMLLDDVLSELDENRQQYLLTRMQGKQVFITACDPNAFYKTDGKIVTMEQGILKE